MGRRYNVYLGFILVLLALVVWIDLPGSPGIHIGSYERNFETKLGLDLRGGLRVLLEVPANVSVTTQQLSDARTILESRANGLGVSEISMQTAGDRRIVGEFPGLTDTSDVISMLKETGQLAFVPMGKDPMPEGSTVQVDLSMVGKPLNEILSATLPASTQATPAAATAAAGSQATPAATPAATAASKVYYAIMTGADMDLPRWELFAAPSVITRSALSLKTSAQKYSANILPTMLGNTWRSSWIIRLFLLQSLRTPSRKAAA